MHSRSRHRRAINLPVKHNSMTIRTYHRTEPCPHATLPGLASPAMPQHMQHLFASAALRRQQSSTTHIPLPPTNTNTITTRTPPSDRVGRGSQMRERDVRLLRHGLRRTSDPRQWPHTLGSG